MASQIKVEVTHKETIQPSSPTPHHLRSLCFSVFDQIQPEIYISLVLFYPSKSSAAEIVSPIDHQSLFSEKTKLLKKSLSKALTYFYPFAGTFKLNNSISCDDHGIAFFEAQVNCSIANILEKPDFEILKQLIPTALESKQEEAGHLLLVKANLFECGGLAIGVSISHKIADVATFSTFIKIWAEIALGSITSSQDLVLHGKFGVAATLFPPQDFLNTPKPSIMFSQEKCITRRYVFDASKIAALKAKAASATVPSPTRVEAVSALIWKCAMEASRSNTGIVKPSLWCQVVNLRKRSPGLALAENILGNFIWGVTEMSLDSEVNLESLAAKLRKGIQEYKEKYPNGLSGDFVVKTLKESGNLAGDDVDFYSCSSWCRFSFYEADFGWGKPLWVSIHSLEYKNMIVLMDLNDGTGMEAILTLKEDDMVIVESNKDLLAYAYLDQTV